MEAISAMILLDTDVLIDCLRGLPAAAVWLRDSANQEFAIPAEGPQVGVPQLPVAFPPPEHLGNSGEDGHQPDLFQERGSLHLRHFPCPAAAVPRQRVGHVGAGRVLRRVLQEGPPQLV